MNDNPLLQERSDEAMRNLSKLYHGTPEVDSLVLDNLMFIDPGLMGTGYAYFDRIVRTASTPRPPISYGVYTPKGCSWESRAGAVCDWLRGMMKGARVKYTILEMSQMWEGSPVSFSSALKGDLFKLTYLIGGMGEVVRTTTDREPVLVTARVWKGQLSKDAVKRRLQDAFTHRYHEHEADAVAMGLSAQGLL